MSELVIGYVPCKNFEEADKIAKDLLESKLIACGNIINSNSMYLVNDEVDLTAERILILKTLKDKIGQVTEKIKELHSYEIPCITFIETLIVNEEYLNWVKSQVS